MIKNNELDAIDNSIFIINYLDDYDIFIKYYQKYLAKRLLSNSNLENEQNIINQINLINNDIVRESEIKEDAKKSLSTLLTEEKKLKRRY